ncbi:hypothetical protein MXB_4751, partial [Myxobolus squamalis]
MIDPDSKVWQYHLGYNVLLCSGRCVTSDSPFRLIVSIILITFSSSLLLAFDCPYFFNNYKLIFYISFPLTLFLLANTLILMLTAALMDPGFEPRARQDETNFWKGLYDQKRRGPGRCRPERIPNILDVAVYGGRTCSVKYCSTCNFFRPLRVSHCRTCDNC